MTVQIIWRRSLVGWIATGFCVFIHVDAKVAIDPFRDLISKDDRVRFLLGRERVAVNWGGYSTVEATLSLLQAALNSPERFDRFCLLSGADFPIKSLNDLHRGLDSQVEFIRVDRRLDDTEDSKHSRYVRYAHSRDGPTKDGSHKGPRKVYDKICLYHGSTWWALTEGCISYIADYVQRNPDYPQFHRASLLSDEIFFHSIVKSSPYAGFISHDFERAADLEAYFDLNEHGCHYIDWNSKGVRLPKVLDDRDFHRLIGSGAYFARKFGDVSERLLERIEEAISTQEEVGRAGSYRAARGVDRAKSAESVLGRLRSGTRNGRRWLSSHLARSEGTKDSAGHMKSSSAFLPFASRGFQREFAR